MEDVKNTIETNYLEEKLKLQEENGINGSWWMNIIKY